MKNLIRFALLPLALLAAGCSNETATPALYTSLASSQAKIDANEARAIINQYRQQKGLKPLVIDQTLMREAADHARDMAAHNKLGHDISRGTLTKRLAARGITPALAAENVSAGYHTLAEAFGGWRGSPPHNTNLLRPTAQRMGIAAAYAPDSKYKVYWAFIVTGN
jgi:uncharacterized protein YkwD